jgi:hypothetical protein
VLVVSFTAVFVADAFFATRETPKDHSRNQSGEVGRLKAPLRADDDAEASTDGGA